MRRTLLNICYYRFLNHKKCFQDLFLEFRFLPDKRILEFLCRIAVSVFQTELHNGNVGSYLCFYANVVFLCCGIMLTAISKHFDLITYKDSSIANGRYFCSMFSLSNRVTIGKTVINKIDAISCNFFHFYLLLNPAVK